MEIFPRSAWGARSPDSVTRLPTESLRGVAIHWFGSPRSPSSPDGVPAVIRSVQNGHMAPGGLGTKDGGSDIGYSHLADMWGRLWTGRGWNVRPGATGPANGTHGAIVYAAGIGDPFTAEAKRAINWLIGEYRRRGAGADVSWHSNFMQTDCPGDVIRAWIRAGRPVTGGEETTVQPWIMPWVLWSLFGKKLGEPRPADAPARIPDYAWDVYNEVGAMLKRQGAHPAYQAWRDWYYVEKKATERPESAPVTIPAEWWDSGSLDHAALQAYAEKAAPPAPECHEDEVRQAALGAVDEARVKIESA